MQGWNIFGALFIRVEEKKWKLHLSFSGLQICVLEDFDRSKNLSTRDYFPPSRNTNTEWNLMQTGLVSPYHLIIYP